MHTETYGKRLVIRKHPENMRKTCNNSCFMDFGFSHVFNFFGTWTFSERTLFIMSFSHSQQTFFLDDLILCFRTHFCYGFYQINIINLINLNIF